MFLVKFAFNNLKGQKKDTMAKIVVLFLSFFFFTMSTVVFSSVLYSSQVERQELYGNWQVMLYGIDDLQKEKLEAVGAGENMPLLGHHLSGELIGGMDESLFRTANLKLVEGRLPQSADEILLVEGAFQGNTKYKTGDSIPVTLLYEDMRITLPVENIAREYIQEGVEANRQQYEEAFASFWEKINENDYEYSRLFGWYDKTPLEEMDEETREYLMLRWLENNGEFEWYVPNTSNTQFPSYYYENVSMRIKQEEVVIKLVGPGFAHNKGKEISLGDIVHSLAVQKTYTVSGVVSSYREQWDVVGLGEMPDAFLNREGERQLAEAIRTAEEEYPEGIPKHKFKNIQLYQDPSKTASQMAEQLLPAYNEMGKSAYKVELFDQAHGQFTGNLIGIGEADGEEQSIFIYGSWSDEMVSIYTSQGEERFRLRDLEEGDVLVEGLLPFAQGPLTLEMLEDSNTYSLRLNGLSYPVKNDTAEMMQKLFSSMLLVITVCASFHIFWVQLRKRQNSTVTIMSIGATDGQVVGLIFLEILLLSVLTALFGTVLGGLGAGLLVTLMDAHIYFEGYRLALGIGGSMGAVFLGAFVPVLLSVSVPLTGKVQVAKQVLHLKPVKKRKEGRITYRHVRQRGMLANRGITLLQITLLGLGSAVILITLFLSGNSFKDYRERVQEPVMPDYTYRVPYAMAGTFLRQTMEELDEGENYALVTAENVFLHCDQWLGEGGSPILNTAYESASRDLVFEKLPEGENAVYTRIYGMEEEGLYVSRVKEVLRKNGVNADTLDWEKIHTGEECILFIPLYQEEAEGRAVLKETPREVLEGMPGDQRMGSLLEVTYSGLYQGLYTEDHTVQVGDMLTITGKSQKMDAVTMTKAESSKTIQTKVAALVYYTKDTGIWPITDQGASYAIVAGYKLVNQVYPQSGVRMKPKQTDTFWSLSETFFPDCYGKTYIYSENQKGADISGMDLFHARFAEEKGFQIDNLRIQKAKIYNNAMENLLMFLLLGLEIGLVLLVILWEICASAIHQESRKLGILQSIGLDERKLQKGQLLQAAYLGIISVGVANVFFALVWIGNAFFTNLGRNAFGARVLIEIVRTARWYPWGLHLLLCVLLFLIYLPVQSYAIFAVSRRDPIENMRS